MLETSIGDKNVKNILIIAALIGCASAWAGVEKNTVANINKQGVGLQGYDPVSYFKSSKPLKGEATHSAQDDGVTYWFANEANQKEFIKEPKKYEPLFGGWCAYAVADSKSKVDIDPESFLIQDGKLLVFYNGLWANTRKKWQHTENKDEKTFLKEAETNWPLVKGKAP
jgi:YHS domain-containing protein